MYFLITQLLRFVWIDFLMLRHWRVYDYMLPIKLLGSKSYLDYANDFLPKYFLFVHLFPLVFLKFIRLLQFLVDTFVCVHCNQSSFAFDLALLMSGQFHVDKISLMHFSK